MALSFSLYLCADTSLSAYPAVISSYIFPYQRDGGRRCVRACLSLFSLPLLPYLAIYTRERNTDKCDDNDVNVAGDINGIGGQWAACRRHVMLVNN